MRLLLLLLLLPAGLLHAQTRNERYQVLQGKIGPYPVVLHLHQSGHRYHGFYYYQSLQHPLMVLGEDTTVSGTITLHVASGAEGEQFRFRFSADSIRGSWQRNEQAKPLPFAAKLVVQHPNWQYIGVRGEQKLFGGTAESPRAGFEAGTVWPLGSAPVAPVVQKKIRSFFTTASTDVHPRNLLQATADSFFTAYHKEHASVRPEEAKETPYIFTAEAELRAMVAYQNDALLTLAMYAYNYSGGAHGNYGTGYTSFDLLSGKVLQLSDVLTPAGQKALPQLLADAFRKQFGLKAGAPLTAGGLFENKIQPTDNFFVTGKGIGFCFVPYEIGPYAMGEIVLFIAYTQVQALLQPSFVNTLKKIAAP